MWTPRPLMLLEGRYSQSVPQQLRTRVPSSCVNSSIHPERDRVPAMGQWGCWTQAGTLFSLRHWAETIPWEDHLWAVLPWWPPMVAQGEHPPPCEHSSLPGSAAGVICPWHNVVILHMASMQGELIRAWAVLFWAAFPASGPPADAALHGGPSLLTLLAINDKALLLKARRGRVCVCRCAEGVLPVTNLFLLLPPWAGVMSTAGHSGGLPPPQAPQGRQRCSQTLLNPADCAPFLPHSP